MGAYACEGGAPGGLLVVLCATSPAFPYQADVELIPQGRYVEVALREIQQAKTSIHLTMYLITLPAAPAGSAVARRAARKVGAMHANNPKKTMGYLIGTIEEMGREE